MKELYNPMSSLGSNPSNAAQTFLYTIVVVIVFILPVIPLEPWMQQRLPCHLATVVGSECRGAVPVSWQSREI
jgi:hypothetical protein